MEREKLEILVRGVQAGDEAAATALYDAFHKDLYYHITKTVDDPELALDLLQDTFLEIFQTIGKLEEPAAFVTWSKQIAYHRCTAWFRKRREILADEDEDGYSVFDTIEEDRAEFIPDEALDKEELKNTIHAMIAQLPEEQRSALLLRYFDEISVKEIAQIQGVTEGTVKSRLNYGRKAIKQAVESYEKKNGIKLHCAGVVPLLLWLFREYAVTNGISLTAAGASASYAAKTGLKAAGSFALKKLIAGIVAAATLVGGITAGILLTRPEKTPMVWVGYDTSFHTAYSRHRVDVVLEKLDEEEIAGYLQVAYLYNPSYAGNFTGTGTEEADGRIRYALDFASDYPVPITAIYDKKAQTLTMTDSYDSVTLMPLQEMPLIAENTTWSGRGTDDYLSTITSDHLLELMVEELRENQICGKLKFSENGTIDHVTDFTGWGFRDTDGSIWYEVALEEPRQMGNSITMPLQYFWLRYDPEAETFAAVNICVYEILLKK